VGSNNEGQVSPYIHNLAAAVFWTDKFVLYCLLNHSAIHIPLPPSIPRNMAFQSGYDAHPNPQQNREIREDVSNEKEYYGSADSPPVGTDLATAGTSRTFQPPELVRAMSPEKRAAAEFRLRRKIDLRLLPMIVLMYILNYLDRNNIAAARLAGLQDDLKLTSVQFSVRIPMKTADGNLADLIGTDCCQYSICRLSPYASTQ
jgi:hypothetical protein